MQSPMVPIPPSKLSLQSSVPSLLMGMHNVQDRVNGPCFTEMYQCLKCSYEFEWKFQADRHVQRQTHGTVDAAKPEHSLPCVCYAFKGFCDLCEHRKHYDRIDTEQISGNNSYYPCHHCTYKSHSSLSLVKHPCKPLKPQITDYKKAITRKRTADFQCAECPYKTNKKHNLRAHMLRHAASEDIAWFRCAQCSYKAKRKFGLKRHTLTRHTSGDDVIAWFECRECPFRAKLKSSVERHTLRHVASEHVRWFGCEQCSYRAVRKDNLKLHMVTHASSEDMVDRSQCSRCSFKVKRKADMKRHMLQHAASEDVRWFRCEQCSYRTNRKFSLKRHMATHASGEDSKSWFECA